MMMQTGGDSDGTTANAGTMIRFEGSNGSTNSGAGVNFHQSPICQTNPHHWSFIQKGVTIEGPETRLRRVLMQSNYTADNEDNSCTGQMNDDHSEADDNSLIQVKNLVDEQGRTCKDTVDNLGLGQGIHLDSGSTFGLYTCLLYTSPRPRD